MHLIVMVIMSKFKKSLNLKNITHGYSCFHGNHPRLLVASVGMTSNQCDNIKQHAVIH